MSKTVKFALFISAGAFGIYKITNPGETPYNYFSLLAQSFVRFSLIVNINAPYLNELIPIGDGNFYVPYAPMPALLLALPTFITGKIISQTLCAQIIGSTIVFFSVLNTQLSTKNMRVSIAIGLLTAFGSGIWFLAANGSSWYFGQLVGILFLSLAIFFKLKKTHPFITGLFLGAAYLARPHLILALPFFIYKNKNIKNLFSFFTGLFPALMFNAWYNLVRFNSLLDKGYTLIPGVLNEPWYAQGIFHYSYIPRQLKTIFFEFPRFQDNVPFIVPELRGMAFWLAFPAVFLIVKINWTKQNLITGLTIFLILIPILMHGSTGFTQFGYRFGLDILPFLLLLIASSLTRLKLNFISKLIIFLSILINAWGIIMINILKIYVF